MARKLAAGNWKMNGTRDSLSELTALAGAHSAPCVDVLICPPATLLHAAVATLGNSPIRIGGQDCHPEASGPHTGDISAAMLVDAGATHVILGHSERREDHWESNEGVNAKIRAAHSMSLVAIACVGEKLEERDEGKTLDIVGEQLAASLPEGCTAANTVVAYEPVWAIGTGMTPTA